jgi:(1->4)-alpha-D-glucan 1-alpha-D-glucosylmutase
LWDLSLVDPDNRREVDFELREKLLRSIQGRTPAALLADWKSGAVKLFTTMRALRVRNEHAAVFQQGGYLPVRAEGEKADHIVAFARRQGETSIVAVVPRFISLLCGGRSGKPSWGDTRLRLTGRYRNVFTGQDQESFSAAELFDQFPVAILEGR